MCLKQVFGKHGLVQENPIGEKFDPNKHDALFQVLSILSKFSKGSITNSPQIPTPDKEPNTVLDVQKVKQSQLYKICIRQLSNLCFK